MKTTLVPFIWRDPNHAVNLNTDARHTLSSPVIQGPAIIRWLNYLTDGAAAAMYLDIGMADKSVSEFNVPRTNGIPYTSLIARGPDILDHDTANPPTQRLPNQGFWWDTAINGTPIFLPLGIYIPRTDAFFICLSFGIEVAAGSGNRGRWLMKIIEEIPGPIECLLGGLV